jgi:hypothetical protein
LWKGIPKEIIVKCNVCSWIQTLDYKHVIFCCRVYFDHGHLVAYSLKCNADYGSRTKVGHVPPSTGKNVFSKTTKIVEGKTIVDNPSYMQT